MRTVQLHCDRCKTLIVAFDNPQPHEEYRERHTATLYRPGDPAMERLQGKRVLTDEEQEALMADSQQRVTTWELCSQCFEHVNRMLQSFINYGAV